MNLKSIKGMAFIAAMAAGTATATASEYYVSPGGVDAAGRGTEASPFQTIQYAIDQAARGDTIWVKPGIYDQGGRENTVNTPHMNRVLLTKMVHLKSTDGAAVTHIVGAPDPTTGGIGPNAVRCMASSDIDVSRNSTITGFTLRDGYGDTANHRAGGFLQQTGQRDIYFSDCVVSNCSSFTHGGARGGTWARCLFTGNTVTTHGTGTDGNYQSAAAVGSANLVHCVIIGNGDSDNDFALSQDYLVNCTVVCNRGRPAPNNGDVKCYFYNCVVCGHCLASNTTIGNLQTVNQYTSTVTSGYPVFSPLEGDFRLVAGSEACSLGSTSYLSSITDIKPNSTYGKFIVASGMVEKDFAGNAIDLTAESVHAGAVQQTVAAEGGVLYLYGPLSCNGVSMPSGMPTYMQATNRLAQWPVVFGASQSSGSTTNYLSYIKRNGGANTLYPTANNSLLMMAPIKDGAASTNEPQYCKARWVNPETGDDANNDGSEAAPFSTIQRAIDAGGANTVIFLAPGLYNQGGVTAADASTAPYANTRVWVTNANVRIVGTAGADHTIIVGAPDSGTGGLGDGAWRCIGGTKTVVFSGMTLSNGWTRASDAATAGSKSGAAAYATGGAKVFLTDGIVTDCHASSHVLDMAHANRCRIFGNSSQDGLIFNGADCRLLCSYMGPNEMGHSSNYYGYVGEYSYAFFSTIVVVNDAQTAFTVNTKLYNCLVSGGRFVKPAAESRGNLFWQATGGDYGTTGISARPKFDADKLHVRETSAALTAGVAPSVAGFDQQETISVYWSIFSSTDLEKNPIRFNDGNSAMVGAFQVPVYVEEFTAIFVR